MEDWTTSARWTEGVRLAALLGACAGLLELFAAVSGAHRPLSGELPALGAVAASAHMALAAVLGVLAGAVHTLRAKAEGYHNVASQVALVAGGLSALHLVPPALGQLDGVSGWILLAMVPLAWFFAGLQLRFWLGRVERRQTSLRSVRLALVALAGATAALVVGTDLARSGSRTNAGDRPPVVLVTVDGASIPNHALPLDALAGGALFTQAIAPSASSLAGHATMLTGLHPLRHFAFDDLHGLRAGAPSVAWRVRDAGWPTGAFVSSAVVGAHTGLADGFDRYDDAFGLAFHLLPVTRELVNVLASAPVERRAAQTVAAFDAWRSGVEGSYFAWVHLDAGDPDLAATLRGLMASLEDAFVVVASPVGAGAGLRDEVVRVPVYLRPPASARADLGLVADQSRLIEPQVRLMDVAPTLVAAAGLDPVQTSEGVDLVGYVDGKRSKNLGAVLLGKNADGGPVLGLRQPDLKVLWDVRTDADTVFDLESDPDERRDIAAEQAEARAAARSMLEPDTAGLEALWARPTFRASDVARVERATRR